MTDRVTEDKMGVRIIRFTGDLTISRAEEVKSALLESLKGAERIEVDLASVEEADLSRLQLLCSAHRTSGRLGKSFSIGGVSDAFDKAARGAGYHLICGCGLGAGGPCLFQPGRMP
jgi:anti-anti-sigma regulatory factor